MRLFIAEKPSLGRAIAENLGKGSKNNGYILINGGDDIVTWCFGHILEQFNPDEYNDKYRRWNMEDLPIVPENWKFKVKKEAAAQLKVIKDLCNKADYIVNAGDPDREGQLLVDEVLEYLKVKKPTKRILLNALDERSVKAALDDLRDNKDFKSFRDSALARSQADWLVGMNLSRAYTIKGRDAGFDGVIRVGRVQTPTLALIVRREQEIANFRATTHYLIQAVFAHELGNIPATLKYKADTAGLDSDGRMLDKKAAEELLDKVAAKKDGAVVSVEQKKKQEGQRLPYSLSTLQIEAGRKYGYSPQQVLDAMQNLYEQKYTTYPRSDCEYLPTNQLNDAKTIIENLSKVEDLSNLCKGADTTIRSRCWNDAKISAHHALIPTSVPPAELSTLSETERRMYILVAKAYLAQFYPIHSYLATKITIECAEETFVANGKSVTDIGWKALYKKDKDEKPEDKDTQEEIELPDAIDGDSVEYKSSEIKEKVTMPPARFTDASLLQAMKEIHKYVKDKELGKGLKDCKGIGTEATRAGIIENLKQAGFCKIEKKKLIPTEKGNAAIGVLPDEITYPDTTAVWEADLDKIVENKLSLDDFIKAQIKKITDLIEASKTAKIATSKDAVLCPDCGNPMRLRKGSKRYFWGCSGYPECKTTFPDKNGKPDINAKKSASTGENEKCPVCGKNLRQIKGKFGVFWGCEDRECNASFPDNKDKPVIVKCPQCGGYLKKYESKKDKGKFFWGCPARCGVGFIKDKSGVPDLSIK